MTAAVKVVVVAAVVTARKEIARSISQARQTAFSGASDRPVTLITAHWLALSVWETAMSWNRDLRPGLVATAVLASIFLGASPAMAQTGLEQFHFLQHCSSCHLVDGSGVPPEVPNLRLDLAKLLKSAAGRDFILRVPGVTETPLSSEEIANLLNWMIATFYPGVEEFEPFTSDEVEAGKGNPLYDPVTYREQHFPDLY